MKRVNAARVFGVLFLIVFFYHVAFAQKNKKTPQTKPSAKKLKESDIPDPHALQFEFCENVTKRAEKMGGLKTTTKEKKDTSGKKYVEVETTAPDQKILQKAMEEENHFMIKHPKTPAHAEYAKMMKKIFLEGKLTEFLLPIKQHPPAKTKKKTK